MDLMFSIGTMFLVVFLALGLITYWENKRWIARFAELSEKDFRGELTPEEQDEYQDMLRG